VTAIRDLARAAPSEVARLRRAGTGTAVETVDDLWEQIGRDPQTGLDALASDHDLSRERVLQLACAQAECELQQGTSFVAEHASGILLVVLAFVITAGLLALRVALPVPTGYGAPLQVRAVAVNAPDGLPAFHRVVDSDLVDVDAADVPGRTLTRDKAVGRYTLAAVASASVLTSGLLGQECPPRPASASPATPQPTSTSTTLRLPIKTAAIGQLDAGACVSLLLSPRDYRPGTPPGASLNNVNVLALSSGPDASILVGLNDGTDLSTLAPLLGVADIFVVRSGA
jgi:hypothetical protein